MNGYSFIFHGVSSSFGIIKFLKNNNHFSILLPKKFLKCFLKVKSILKINLYNEFFPEF